MIIKIAVFAVMGAFLTAYIKNMKPEYGQLLLIAMGIFLFFLSLTYLDVIKELVDEIREYMTIKDSYLSVMLKMTGIAYVCEFASSLCKDAGCTTIASQIELIGKLSMMLLGLPIISALAETIGRLF